MFVPNLMFESIFVFFATKKVSSTKFEDEERECYEKAFWWDSLSFHFSASLPPRVDLCLNER